MKNILIFLLTILITNTSLYGEDIDITLNHANKIVFVGDSLTELRTTSSFTREVAEELKYTIGGGNRELGYLPFTLYYVVKNGASKHGIYRTKLGSPMTKLYISSYARAKGMWGESDAKWYRPLYSHSPDGKGIYFLNGTGNDFIGMDIHKGSFDVARVYYLKQPNGGTFLAHFRDSKTEDKVYINTNSSKYSLAYVDIKRKGNPSKIRMTKIKGKVAIYGVNTIYKRVDSKAFFKYDVFARNGIMLRDFTHLNAEATTKYYSDIKPDIVFINIGTNDLKTIGIEEYRLRLMVYVNRIKQGSPKTQIVLIEPNRPKNYNKGRYKNYTLSRKYLSRILKWGYIDIPEDLGKGDRNKIMNFEDMNRSNLMEDGVHPNKAGKKAIADCVLEYIYNNMK